MTIRQRRFDAPALVSGQMTSVLVVDDRDVDRELLGTLLGQAGHLVLEAASGEEALVLAQAERPDLVITDILMPAMNGYELVRRLRSRSDTDAIPVIFCTANSVEGEVRKLAAACGVSDFIPKPYDPDTIVGRVGEVLGSPEWAEAANQRGVRSRAAADSERQACPQGR